MPPIVRRSLLVVALAVVASALVWASLFETLPPADFSLQNGSDAKTLDPARAEGQPESRLIFELFEGLLKMMPDGEPDPITGLQPMSPQPGIAESYEVSDDNLTYTFRLRKDARWTDGSPVTSADFAFSWQRMLHPEVLCQYTYHLYGLPYAQAYNQALVDVGDRVEVELWDRPGDSPDQGSGQPFPRGSMVYGVVTAIDKEPEPQFPDPLPAAADDRKETLKQRDKVLADWRERWVYHVRQIEPATDGSIDWEAEGETAKFCVNMASKVADQTTTRCHWVLVAFGKLGVLETPDPHTFIVHLRDPVPYFPNTVAFYPTFPVNRKCIETHGSPLWTKPENIVSNGPYKLQFRLLRDRLRLVKNEDYHAVNPQGFNTIDFMAVEKDSTAMNMYETGQLQWVTDPPLVLLDELKQRPDFRSAPMLTVYFYRFNVNAPPLNDVRVRRAIAMAINREQIVNQVTRGGQTPAYSIVPPGIAGYQAAPGFEYDVAEAKRLLAEAGYPGGRGMPKITVLYNTSESHRDIAEVVQQQLRNTLNIPLSLENMEWGSYLDKVTRQDYQLARAGWIADYPDPNTFLDLWVTDGPQNNTGWSNPEYDELITAAARERDPQRRMEILRDAEAIFIEELPVIPFYFYTSLNVVDPRVENFAPTPQDLHPLHLLQYPRSPNEN
jgi:oligopeptide transport system substrate-binding protein